MARKTKDIGMSSPQGEGVTQIADELATTYPAKFDLTNNTPSKLVFPNVTGEILMPYETVTGVEFQDESQMARFITDVEHLSELNKWENAVTLTGADDGVAAPQASQAQPAPAQPQAAPQPAAQPAAPAAQAQPATDAAQ